MNRPHLALIYFSVEFSGGLEKLRQTIQGLRENGETLGVSSIYKRFLTSRSEDLNSEICLVVKLETPLSETELDQFLHKLVEEHLREPRKQGRALLLSYDQTMRLAPSLPLPNPQLRNDGLTLRCAAEVWGGYEHPVLGQSLNELVKSSEPMATAEFFAQGISLK
jgi:7,8-dihydro-6-hydroxymethylpterin-pyrophosphokinase